MIRCSRCKTGRLTNRSFSNMDDELICLSCGYEAVEIPADVLAEVKKSHGQRTLKVHKAQLPTGGSKLMTHPHR